MKQDISDRYAQALFEVAKEDKKEKLFLEELKLVAEVFEKKEIAEFFSSQAVNVQKKMETLRKALPEIKVSEPLKNFLYLICVRGRVSSLQEIFNSYKEKFYTEQGICLGKVSSTEPLSENTAKDLTDRLEQVLGKKVMIENLSSKTLVGGLTVDILGRRFTNSIFSQLSRLKETIEGRRV